MTKKIFKSVGLIALAIAVAVGSFFVPISKKDTSYFASADSSTITGIEFNSSDIFFSRLGSIPTIPNSFADLTSSSSYIDDSAYWVLNWSFNINYGSRPGSSNPHSLEFFAKGYIYQNSSSTAGFGTYTGSTPPAVPEFVSLGSLTLRESARNKLLYYFNNSVKVGYTNQPSNFGYTMLGCALFVPDNDLFPSLDIVTIEIGNYSSFPFPQGISIPSEFSTNSNIVCYTDTNEFKYYFFIPTWYSYEQMPMSYLSYRLYYTSNSLDLSEQQVYQQGYNEGLMANQQNIYENGYTTGYDDGFDNGRITGGAEANDYSFFSLFGAIFDAPVTLFTSLLNFDFLGINLWSFVTALLTLAIILFVIKLFIRR